MKGFNFCLLGLLGYNIYDINGEKNNYEKQQAKRKLELWYRKHR